MFLVFSNLTMLYQLHMLYIDEWLDRYRCSM